MANNVVTVSGMFGNEKTYFADSPVVIDIDGLEWPDNSPFNIVRGKVLFPLSDSSSSDSSSSEEEDNIVGDFHADTGGQSSISFDIQSALRAIWTDYDFTPEVAAAQAAVVATSVAGQSVERSYREYALQLYTEYLDSGDNEFVISDSQTFPGGQCMIGGLTEWERANIGNKENADAAHWEHSNPRNGDASTKPRTYPERVGKSSITSWVDVNNNGTTSVFYPPAAPASADSHSAHAPIVLRDTLDYQDFIFVNRRGAVETCSAQMLEALDIEIETTQYGRIERPSFQPSRSIMTVSSGGRRSWAMSSGYQTREWAEWWTLEFLKAKRVWMLYKGIYVPVTVEPAKKNTNIYDRTNNNMPHVDFTVTLALEG